MRTTNRVKAEPKLTQQQIIDRMIEDSAFQQASDHRDNFRTHGYTAFINPKNLPTLRAMAKRGILVSVDSSNNCFKLSPDTLAKYTEIIRQKAEDMINWEYLRDRGYHESENEKFRRICSLRFLATKISKRYWTNTDKFHFIDWTFTDEYGKQHEINCSYEHECAVSSEARLQAAEQRLIRVWIGALPHVEICAI